MTRFNGIHGTVALSALLIASAAFGADNVSGKTAAPAAAAKPMAAQKCVQDLQALNDRMEKDGYWLTGWGSRWGAMAPVTSRPATEPAAGRSDVAAPVSPRADVGPWGSRRYGVAAPSYQIRTLHAAAGVLARRDDQQGCNAVLSELRTVYDAHIATLKQAGVDPGEVNIWRMERILAAVPVEQLEVPVPLSDLTGTEIRNRKDEKLGTIDDVLVDPDSGKIQYAVVSHGGFLGIGNTFVAVPWSAFQATPGLRLAVLDVSEDVLEAAPRVDPDEFTGRVAYDSGRQRIDEYWQQHGAG